MAINLAMWKRASTKLDPPAGYPIWPRWFSTVCFVHIRRFGNLFILGVAADTALRLLLPAFWHAQ